MKIKIEAFFNYLPKKIEFWIILFFIIRLIGIQNPPLENIHNFRQSTVWMVARNFKNIDNNILYPRIDFAGNNSGLTAMEFPILNYLIYLLAKIFGFQHWIGRFIVLIISSIGLYCFYQIVTRFLAPNWAKLSTFLLMLSIYFTYSRKTMPDVFSISLITIGLFCLIRFIESNRWIFNLLFIILCGIGMLSKASSFPFFISFLAWIVWINKDKFDKSKQLILIFSFTMVIGVVFWYYKIWCPYLKKLESNDTFFLGNSISEGFLLISEYIAFIAQKFYFEAMKWSGFFIFIAGFYLLFKNKLKSIYVLVLTSSLTGILLILISLKTFATHSYYVIPLVPFMSIIAAYFIYQLKSKPIIFILILIYSLESLLSHKSDFYITSDKFFIENLSKDIESIVPQKSLILVNSDQNPTPLYFAGRKGWAESNHFISNSSNVDSLKKIGLEYIIVLKRGMGANIKLDYSKKLETNNFTLYKV